MEIVDENSFKINQIEEDEFKRTSAVLAVKKPSGVTSHDIVDLARRKLRTRKVGHAGALDPFATGVLIILVGKYTKSSDFFLNSGKEYRCKVLFGVSTDTQDPEGKVTSISEGPISSEGMRSKLMAALANFKSGYMQRVPIFSSVKVNGQKLRKIARQAERFEIGDKDSVTFFMKNGKELKLVLPRKKVEFTKLELLSTGEFNIKELGKSLEELTLPTADLLIGCSKGTYIRQFAEDLGKFLGMSAMLLELERTKVGDISINDCVEPDDLPQL